jgi:hypothetical protein
MAIQYGPQIFRTDQKCDNCPGAILVQPQCDDGSGAWGGQERPLPNRKWCENGCPPE